MTSLQDFIMGDVPKVQLQAPHDLTKGQEQLLTWRAGGFDEQWVPGLIPKLTAFTYWNRRWEVRVSNYAFMGWGLFALDPAKAGRSC
jgi:hypothetical protein